MPKTSIAMQTAEKVAARLMQHVSPRVTKLVDQKIELKAERERIDLALKELDKKLLKEADDEDGEIETAEWKLTSVDSENRSIQKDTLLALGVKPTIIAKATKVTPYRYVKLTVKKGAA